MDWTKHAKNNFPTSLGRILFKYDWRNKSPLNWFPSFGASWKKEPLLEAANGVPLEPFEISLLSSSRASCKPPAVLFVATKLRRKSLLGVILVLNILHVIITTETQEVRGTVRLQRDWLISHFMFCFRPCCLRLSNRAFYEMPRGPHASYLELPHVLHACTTEGRAFHGVSFPQTVSQKTTEMYSSSKINNYENYALI